MWATGRISVDSLHLTFLVWNTLTYVFFLFISCRWKVDTTLVPGRQMWSYRRERVSLTRLCNEVNKCICQNVYYFIGNCGWLVVLLMLWQQDHPKCPMIYCSYPLLKFKVNCIQFLREKNLRLVNNNKVILLNGMTAACNCFDSIWKRCHLVLSGILAHQIIKFKSWMVIIYTLYSAVICCGN